MKIKILVVEDDPVTQKILQSLLEKAQYDVTLAADGLEGLKIIDSKITDLIITDYMMPNMDGLALFKKLRSNKASKHIPVIILTIKHDMQSSFEFLGVNCFLSKPVHPGILLTNVELLIQRNKLIDKGIVNDSNDDEKFSVSDLNALIEEAKEGKIGGEE